MTDSETEHKSTVTFRHEYSTMKVVKGVRESCKENIIDGEKGLYISLLTKNGDDFYRARIKQTGDDSFDMEEKKGEKETKSVITMDELKTSKYFKAVRLIPKEKFTYFDYNFDLYKNKTIQDTYIFVIGNNDIDLSNFMKYDFE